MKHTARYIYPSTFERIKRTRTSEKEKKWKTLGKSCLRICLALLRIYVFLLWFFTLQVEFKAVVEIISNEKIQAFIEERKCIHDRWQDKFITRWNGNSKERILEIVGDAGHEFRIIVRENKFNPSRNFSVVLGVYYPTPNKVFRLLRYNGSNHCHMGHIRYECHIHRATEEYQNAKEREDSYAEKTSRYQDVSGALKCLIDDANFQGNHILLQEVKLCLLGL